MMIYNSITGSNWTPYAEEDPEVWLKAQKKLVSGPKVNVFSDCSKYSYNELLPLV